MKNLEDLNGYVGLDGQARDSFQKHSRKIMPHPTTSDSNARKVRTRLDPSHEVRESNSYDSIAPALDTLAAIAGSDPARLPEQMQRQAEHLGSQLQSQQRELDRREAEFNARAARLENELRTARLIFQEREVSLQKKYEEFERCFHTSVDMANRVTEFRSRLDDQYRLTNENLANQKEEIVELLGKLESHTARLGAQREELRCWVAQRHSEVESPAPADFSLH